MDIERLEKNKWVIAVILLIVLYTGIFTFLSILRYKSFFSYEWEDQATHHQLIWNTAHGKWFYNSIGISGYYFSFHFQPIILFQSLIYRIWPHIYNFFLIMSFALGVGALPLYFIAKKLLKSCPAAFIISLSYLLYTPLHNINFCDGDPVIFTIPLFFFLLMMIQNSPFKVNLHRLRNFILLALLALMCKENVGFTILIMGIYLIFNKKTKLGLGCLISAAIWLLISLPITCRLFASQGQPLLGPLNYGSFGELISIFFTKPAEFLHTFFSINHLQYLFKIFMPLAFFPLFSVISYISIPALTQLMLVKGTIEYCSVYYISPAIPFLFIGLIHTIKKISNFISSKIAPGIENNKIVLVISLLILILNISNIFSDNILGNVTKKKVIYDKRFMNAKNIFDPIFYTMDEEDKTAWSFISMIPKHASVSTTGDLLPALSSRTALLELFHPDYDYLDSDYILFHTRYLGFGGGDYCKVDSSSMYQLIKEIKMDPRWVTLREENKFILFKRRKK